MLGNKIFEFENVTLKNNYTEWVLTDTTTGESKSISFDELKENADFLEVREFCKKNNYL